MEGIKLDWPHVFTFISLFSGVFWLLLKLSLRPLHQKISFQDKNFESIDKRFDAVDKKFESMDNQIKDLRNEMHQGFYSLQQYILLGKIDSINAKMPKDETKKS